MHDLARVLVAGVVCAGVVEGATAENKNRHRRNWQTTITKPPNVPPLRSPIPDPTAGQADRSANPAGIGVRIISDRAGRGKLGIHPIFCVSCREAKDSSRCICQVDWEQL